MSINRVFIVRSSLQCSKIHFLFNKTEVFVYIDLSGIINCNVFSLAPSIINENAKNAVPLIFDVNISAFSCWETVLATFFQKLGEFSFQSSGHTF
jgi:hypothetical protein